MQLSTTDFIDGKAVFEPNKNSAITSQTVYDPNSGNTINGSYRFKVIQTKIKKTYTHDRISEDDLNYLKSLLLDENGNIKEFEYTCDYMGETITCFAKLENNITAEQIIKNKLYGGVEYSILQTR